jgi:hypothetical protein
LSRTKPTSFEPGSSSVRHSRSERALRVRRRITLLPSRKSGRNNRRGGHSCPPPKNSAGGRQPSRLHFGAVPLNPSPGAQANPIPADVCLEASSRCCPSHLSRCSS